MLENLGNDQLEEGGSYISLKMGTNFLSPHVFLGSVGFGPSPGLLIRVGNLEAVRPLPPPLFLQMHRSGWFTIAVPLGWALFLTSSH